MVDLGWYWSIVGICCAAPSCGWAMTGARQMPCEAKTTVRNTMNTSAMRRNVMASPWVWMTERPPVWHESRIYGAQEMRWAERIRAEGTTLPEVPSAHFPVEQQLATGDWVEPTQSGS